MQSPTDKRLRIVGCVSSTSIKSTVPNVATALSFPDYISSIINSIFPLLYKVLKRCSQWVTPFFRVKKGVKSERRRSREHPMGHMSLQPGASRTYFPPAGWQACNKKKAPNRGGQINQTGALQPDSAERQGARSLRLCAAAAGIRSASSPPRADRALAVRPAWPPGSPEIGRGVSRRQSRGQKRQRATGRGRAASRLQIESGGSEEQIEMGHQLSR
jgi:hypothetical protein